MDNKFELDLTLLSKELKLLLELLREDNEGNIQLNKEEWFSDVDWIHFLQLTKHHRVYPLIYVRLKSMDENLVPSEVIATLYKEYKRNTFQMLQLSAEMERISKLFTENGIRLLFLKGPVVANDLYGDISLRTSRDLDILVPTKHLEKVENLLLGLGYERDERLLVLNERKWRHHHIEYFHPQHGIRIEIHWRLHPPPKKEVCFDDLWRRKRICSLTSYPVFFLGKEDLFLYLVVHGARHGWLRLRWLKDIDQMIRQGIYFEEIQVLLKKYKSHFVSGQALILVSQLMNTQINKELKGLTMEKRSRCLAYNAYLYIMGSKDNFCDRRYLLSLEPRGQRIFSIVMLFYPRSEDMGTLKLPKPLHFLYFLLRPILWLWRKKKKRVLL